MPKPAGAETSVRGYFRLSSSKVCRRGREIIVPDVMGTKNLVASSWLWMTIDLFMIVYLAHAANICFTLPVS